jgi:acyl-CoA synthetase (AMP-forming)/AMP-acid ligase II
MPEVLLRNAEVHGAKDAIVTEDERITHAELDARSRTFAARLLANGVTKGHRIGLLAPNDVEWAVVSAAVMRIGAVLVPLSTLLRPPELAAQLDVARVRHLLAVREFRGRTFDVPGAWYLDDLPTGTVDEAMVDAIGEVVRPSDDLVVLFTSGSRGAPKGVVHTHGSGLRAVEASREARCLHPEDRLYVPMPFFWTGGFCTGLLASIAAGATLLTEAIPDPERTLAFLERERVTLFRGWPDQGAALAAHPRYPSADLSSLQRGSVFTILPPDRRPQGDARPNTFGMTETFGPYLGAPLDVDLPDEARGSCGRAFDGYEVESHDGVLCVRGPNVLRTILGRTRQEVFDADGWYVTGDLGDIDAGGWVWFRGRADDMFKVKGATVYPSEVEAAVRSVPGVQQAHVTDVDGEVGALVVTGLDLGQLVPEVKARLSAFKVPTRWVVTPAADDVPMLPSAKIDKPALQARLREGDRT